MVALWSRARIARALLAVSALALSSAASLAQDAIWGVRFGGLQGGTGFDIAAVPQGDGDFYVCGIVNDTVQYVFGAGTSNEIVKPRGDGRLNEPFLARYRADGTPVWVRMGRGNALDTAERLEVLADGSILICGRFQDGFAGPGVSPNGLTLEGGSAPDVTLNTTWWNESYIARYTPDGDLLFARKITREEYPGVRNYYSAMIRDVTALDDGGFALVGYFSGVVFGDLQDPSPIAMPLADPLSTRPDGFLARYRPNGDILWVERVESSEEDLIHAVEALPDGDLAIVCEFGDRDSLPATLFPGHAAELLLPVDPARSTYILRLDFAADPSASTAAFTIAWIHAIGARRGASPRNDHVIRSGPAGELYIAGYLHPGPLDSSGVPQPATYDAQVLQPGSHSPHFYVARIAPEDGALLWSVGTLQWPIGMDIAPMADGLALVANDTGSNGESIVDSTGAPLGSFFRACHAKLDRDGNLAWIRSDIAGVFGVAVIQESSIVATGTSASFLDYQQPTQITLGAPLYRGYVARYGTGSGTSLVVPADIARSCDPGVHGATVNFVIEVGGAPSGSRLVVRDTTHATLLLELPDPSGSVGVGPVLFPMGVSAISVQLLDASSAVLLEDGFLVTVEDTTPPTLDGCGPRTIECTGPETHLLLSLLGITASDDCDPTPVISLAPAALPMGTTEVTATARDDAGNASSCSFLVTVQDTIAPLFTVIPADIERECSMPGGAIVGFDVLAEDACGIASLVCVDQTNRPIDPAGTFFADGVHTVTCTASDPSSNASSVSFQVRIFDNTAPVLVAPNDLSLPNDPGECTAVAHFEVRATDLCDPAVAITCTAPWGPVRSGDAFPIGTTTVLCVALDRSQNRAEASFSITVYDAEPPIFGGNAGGSATLITDCAGRPIGADAASLGVTVEDNCDLQPTTECTPATLLPGITTVTLTARDVDGNAATTTVLVTVLRGAFHCEVLRPLDPHVDNRIQAGRVVPIKLRVACEGHEVLDATVTIDAIERLATDGTPIANELVEDPGASHDGGNLFRLATNQYHYNLSTSGWVSTSGVRHRVTVRIQKAGHVDTRCEIYLINR